MSDSESLKKKKESAERIKRNAEYYKVCEGCESVVLYTSDFCPLCSGYRFNEEIDAVIKFVDALLKKEKTSILPPDQLS